MANFSAERIESVALDEARIIRRTPEVEHERRVAIEDLLAGNELKLLEGEVPGPYALFLSVREGRLLLRFTGRGQQTHEIELALSPLRSTIKDYFLMCESYYEAVKHPSAERIQTIDMARRSVHNEGSELLRGLLSHAMTMDLATARRLFTLICVLHIR